MSKPPPPTGGMSLYADLLEPKADGDASGSTARKPVVFNKAGAGASSANKKPLDPALLRFQPMRRPQLGQKPKPKVIFPKIPAASAQPPASGAKAPTTSTEPSTAAPPAAAQTATAPSGTTTLSTSSATEKPAPPPSTAATAAPGPSLSKLADWVATEEDEYRYGTGAAEKRLRGGRRQKKKKGQRDDQSNQATDWDDLYDPSRPTNIKEYLRSDERIAEIREWKTLLYAHRRLRRRRSTSSQSSDEERERPAGTNQFAPPPSYSFAPPPMSPPSQPVTKEEAPTAAVPVPEDTTTGDDAYARRLALSGMAGAPQSPRRSPSPPPRAAEGTGADPAASGATISRAAVRYSDPDAMDIDPISGPPHQDGADDDEDEDDQPRAGLGSSSAAGQADEPGERSTLPGQAGFAARMMSKMGWQKGTGLGAEGTGIVTGLSVQVEKRRRRPDAEGGGFAEPAGKGRVVGGRLAAAPGGGKEDAGKFGRMSDVVVLRGMLEGMEDLAAEVEDGLGQEIGEECGEKYGRVERLYIDVENRQVFIKFTDQVSALRAVNALVGRVFNGNTIVPSFYDSDKFESGVYV